jgi:hypothetical protein
LGELECEWRGEEGGERRKWRRGKGEYRCVMDVRQEGGRDWEGRGGGSREGGRRREEGRMEEVSGREGEMGRTLGGIRMRGGLSEGRGKRGRLRHAAVVPDVRQEGRKD